MPSKMHNGRDPSGSVFIGVNSSLLRKRFLEGFFVYDVKEPKYGMQGFKSCTTVQERFQWVFLGKCQLNVS